MVDMFFALDTEFENGIKIRRELAPERLTIRGETEHEVEDLVERYTLDDVGGGRQALSAAAHAALEKLAKEKWFRYGIKESDDHKRVIITGTNSVFVGVS